MTGTHTISAFPPVQSPERAAWFARVLLAALAIAGIQPARAVAAPSPLALGDDERLVYRVSWALLPSVGEIRVSASSGAGPGGARVVRVLTTTRTRGLAHLLLPFEARADSLFDATSGRLVRLEESSDKRGRSNTHTVLFDYPAGRAVYSTGGAPPARRLLPMPPGYPTDLITSLLAARAWGLKPGGTRETLVLFEDEFYQLTVHALGYETVTTPMGPFHTLVLEPRMEREAPKGMFKRGSKVRVWISQDSLCLPVRFQVEFKIGSGTATLVEYRPPAAP
jgi:Protein of unknown function (DUF3108)